MKNFLKDYSYNFFIALPIVWIIGAFPNIYENTVVSWERYELKQAAPTDFLAYEQPVDSVKQIYEIGEAPQFNFIRRYYQWGPIVGDNVLRCDGFRSKPFQGIGYITEQDIGDQQDNIFGAHPPFVFGGNLPDFETTCALRSVITLCHHRHTDICKTITTDSESFTYQ